jgi:Kef-type K+ transport system membrane component KefB
LAASIQLSSIPATQSSFSSSRYASPSRSLHADAQAVIILVFCRLLHFPLSYLRQPRVIAEVLGGILLGPSVMMRIPGFKEDIFPTASMPPLNLVANIGLVLFLFLVGLEVDVRLFVSNWRVALSVGLAGMVLPFSLGCAIAWGLYNQFRDDPGTVRISFGVYALFIGTALSITAFPVLCRILTELKLLGTSVGTTVLAAGVGNDVVGWILLALCVALVNNGSGINALYVLLAAVAWVLFLFFAIKPAFHWLLRRTASIQNGPTQSMVALTVLLVLVSSWFTSIIGVHAIFGAFLVGLICPHDGGFAIKLTEKIEDLVSVLFLPLYFALSGLSTNLGLLNDGITWGYVIGVTVVAFAGKIIGGTIAARLNMLVWRESLTIGVLMSCKGLVELIVLVSFYHRYRPC